MAENIKLINASNLFSKDAARSTHWDIKITGPGFEHTKDNLITGFDTPTLAFTAEEEESPTRIRDVPTFYKPQDFKVDYFIDYQFQNYKDYWNWMNKIFNLKDRKLDYIADNIGKAIITTYDVTWEKNSKIELDEIYPKNVSGLTFSHEKGQILTFSVTFSIIDFKIS